MFILDEVGWSDQCLNTPGHIEIEKTFARGRVIVVVLTILVLEPLTCLWEQ